MPRKHTDDTIYVKRDGKYVAAGKWFDRDTLGFGNFFVCNTKFKRGMNSIKAAPDPNFIELETAVEECREELRILFRNILSSPRINEWMYDFDAVDAVIQTIRKTFLDKKKKMLDHISQ
jgi:hypothetical protein